MFRFTNIFILTLSFSLFSCGEELDKRISDDIQSNAILLCDASIYGDACNNINDFVLVKKDELKPENIVKGSSIGGVTGNANQVKECSSDNEVGCVTTDTYRSINIEPHLDFILSDHFILNKSGRVENCSSGDSSCYINSLDFKAAESSKLIPSNIRSSVSIGGVDGAFDGGHSTCSSENHTGCLATDDYPSVPIGLKSYLLSSQRINDQAGSIPYCTSGGSSCYINGDGLKAAETGLLTSSNIKHDVTIGEVLGSYNGDYTECNSDGSTGCIATNTYKAINISNHRSEIISSANIFGVTGSFIVPSSSMILQSASYGVGGELSGTVPYCSVTGSGCYLKSYSQGVSGYQLKALNYDDIDSKKSNIKNGYELVAGIEGTQTLCSAGSSSCYIDGASLKAAETSKLIAANIKSGITLGGVNGNYAGDYSECSVDGSTGCIATSTYKAINISNHVSKIISSANIFGIYGSFDVPPASVILPEGSYGVAGSLVGTIPYCSATGSGCYLRSYSQGESGYQLKALNYDELYSRRSYIKNGYELVAGIEGTQTLCSAGSSSCYIDGASLKAAESSKLLASNIKNGISIGGVGGTYTGDYSTCDADGTVGCITTSTYKPINISNHVSKIINSADIFGVYGTYSVPPPSVILQGGSYGVGGSLVGSVPYCSATGSGCYLKSYSQGVSGYQLKALDYDDISSKKSNIKNGYELVSGITGTQSLCSDGDNSCYINGTSLTAVSSSNLVASNIKKDEVIGGVTGQYPSSLYPLEGATATTDLTSTNFNDLLVLGDSFEWFDSIGTKHTGVGDTDLVEDNIKKDVDIFGTVGTLEGGIDTSKRMATSTMLALSLKKKSGRVICVGNSYFGGDCSALYSSLADVTKIVSLKYDDSVAYGATVALKENGSVLGWGNISIPVELESTLSSGVTDIASTLSAFAALKEDSVVAWGSSSYGGEIPVGLVSDLSSDVVSIFSNDYAFAAVKEGGSVVTWGNSSYGGDSSNPTGGSLSSGVDRIYSTRKAFAAVKDDKSVVCWGDSNFGGDCSSVIGLENVTKIYGTTDYSTGAAFAAVKEGGGVVAWGYSSYGGEIPAGLVSSLSSGVTDIVSNTRAFAALKGDSVIAWGESSYGGYMSPETASSLSSGVLNIFSNGSAFAAIKQGGAVVTWGVDYCGGQIPLEKVSSLSSGVTSIASTFDAFAALKEDGTVVAWGSYHGGDTSEIRTYTESSDISDIDEIFGAGIFFIGVRKDESYVVWGYYDP